MLLLRRAANAVGLRPARTFLPTPFTSAAATTRFFSITAFRLDAADPTPSTSTDPLPSTLWAPWQLSDLKSREVKLYKTYGTDYIDHVDAETQQKIRKRIDSRKKVEAIVKEELGDEDKHFWYEVMRESNKRFLALMSSMNKKLKRREQKLGSIIEGQETPEQRELALEKKEHEQDRYHEMRSEIRQQVLEELRKQS